MPVARGPQNSPDISMYGQLRGLQLKMLCFLPVMRNADVLNFRSLKISAQHCTNHRHATNSMSTVQIMGMQRVPCPLHKSWACSKSHVYCTNHRHAARHMSHVHRTNHGHAGCSMSTAQITGMQHITCHMFTAQIMGMQGVPCPLHKLQVQMCRKSYFHLLQGNF